MHATLNEIFTLYTHVQSSDLYVYSSHGHTFWAAPSLWTWAANKMYVMWTPMATQKQQSKITAECNDMESDVIGSAMYYVINLTTPLLYQVVDHVSSNVPNCGQATPLLVTE